MPDTSNETALSSATAIRTEYKPNSPNIQSGVQKAPQSFDANANLLSSGGFQETNSSTDSAEAKVKEMKAKAKAKDEKEKKEKDERDLKARVENSVRGRIGKKAIRERGELYRRVFGEEMEREVARRGGIEGGGQGEGEGFAGAGDTAAGKRGD